MSKLIIVTPDSLSIGVNQQDNSVGVRVNGLGRQVGMVEEIEVVLRFSPSEAKDFALRLAKMGLAALEKSSPPSGSVPIQNPSGSSH